MYYVLHVRPTICIYKYVRGGSVRLACARALDAHISDLYTIIVCMIYMLDSLNFEPFGFLITVFLLSLSTIV